MNYCTSCKNDLPAEAFIYKGKNYKTCSNCLDMRSRKRNLKKRPLSNDNNHENELDVIYDDVSFTKIIEYVTSKFANLGNNDMLLFNLHVELDDIVLNTAQYEAKNVVRLIVDEIEGFDRYNWVFTTGPEMSLRHHGVGLFYLFCSQCQELEHEHKESNRKRIIRFDCHSKLIIRIDIPAREVMIRFHHDFQHKKPIDVTTPPE
ncbi:17829_t:CDS:1, partial [Racocetra fulgida]